MVSYTTRPQQWANKIKKLEIQREKNVDRYVAPLDLKIMLLKDKLRNHYL